MTDYNYYITKFDGKKITFRDDFELYADIAYRYVKNVVCDKAEDSDIHDAVCAVCEFLKENSSVQGIKSESADGVSINYENTDINKNLYGIIKLYIPSKLLYRGLNC